MADFSKLMERKAAALKYDSEKNGAPMIVAAGMGHMAEKITETAMKAGVPVYEEDSLASLVTPMKLGRAFSRDCRDLYLFFGLYRRCGKRQGRTRKKKRGKTE